MMDTTGGSSSPDSEQGHWDAGHLRTKTCNGALNTGIALSSCCNQSKTFIINPFYLKYSLLQTAGPGYKHPDNNVCEK